MDTDLLTHTRTFLAQHDLFTPSKRLVAAVSGGTDSLALLHMLVQLRDQGGPHLHVAHLDHGFRGADSAADAAFVAAQSAQWHTPATIHTEDVPALAQAWRLSAQAAARRARYAFLAQVACREAAQAVVTAHQADDQAETVLFHAMRGAGPAGLRGMRPSVPWAEWAAETSNLPTPTPQPALLRPLLHIPRAELAAYCTAAGLTPRDDPSNSAEYYTRSRIRTTLLPAFQALNPHVVEALGRTAAICADDYAFIQSQLDAVWPTLTHTDAGRIAFERTVWNGLHVALQRYALRRAAELLGRSELSLNQIEAARACAASGAGKVIDLGPDVRLETEYDRFILRRTTTLAPPSVPQLASDMLQLSMGSTPLGNGWFCVIQPAPPTQLSPWWFGLRGGPGTTLSLRLRRPGDRIRPIGGPGSRTLQDLFVDLKVPRAQRAAWPILLVNDEIAWVAGLRADARYAAPPDQATIWVGIIHFVD